MNDTLRLAFIRALHTAIYLIVSCSIFALLYAGATGASGAWLWVALMLASLEVIVFLGSGAKCPLTAVATKYGAKPGHDTCFPEAITRHTLAFFGPMLVISLALLTARWAGLLT